MERIEEELGPIDVWVNVAFTSVFARFDDIAPAEFRRVTEVSYLGYVYGTMAVLRRMRPRDAARSSRSARRWPTAGIPLQTAYCGAKHAIQGFHESLRCELLHEQQQRHGDHGADAGGEHAAVLLGAVAAARARRSRCRRSTSPRWPPGRRLRRRPSAPPRVLGRARRPRRLWSPTRWCRAARPLPRPDRVLGAADQAAEAARTSRPTCGSRPTATGGHDYGAHGAFDRAGPAPQRPAVAGAPLSPARDGCSRGRVHRCLGSRRAGPATMTPR